jgi:DNA-binding transcriptional MerR regulator
MAGSYPWEWEQRAIGHIQQLRKSGLSLRQIDKALEGEGFRPGSWAEWRRTPATDRHSSPLMVCAVTEHRIAVIHDQSRPARRADRARSRGAIGCAPVLRHSDAGLVVFEVASDRSPRERGVVQVHVEGFRIGADRLDEVL